MRLAGVPGDLIDAIEKDQPAAAALIKIAKQAQPLIAEALPLVKQLLPLYAQALPLVAQALPLLVKLQPLIAQGDPLLEQAVGEITAILPTIEAVAAFVEKKKAEQAVLHAMQQTPYISDATNA